MAVFLRPLAGSVAPHGDGERRVAAVQLTQAGTLRRIRDLELTSGSAARRRAPRADGAHGNDLSRAEPGGVVSPVYLITGGPSLAIEALILDGVTG